MHDIYWVHLSAAKYYFRWLFLLFVKWRKFLIYFLIKNLKKMRVGLFSSGAVQVSLAAITCYDKIEIFSYYKPKFDANLIYN